MDKWKEETLRQAHRQANQALLEQFEVYMKHQATLKLNEKDTSCSFTEKLVARIIDNLQVKVENVYFRFEDELRGPSVALEPESKRHFCIGLKLKEFEIFTSDKSFKKKEVGEKSSSTLTFKVALFNEFNLFCDWENIDSSEAGGVSTGILKDQDRKDQYFKDIIEREFGDGKRISLAQHKDLMKS